MKILHCLVNTIKRLFDTIFQTHHFPSSLIAWLINTFEMEIHKEKDVQSYWVILGVDHCVVCILHISFFWSAKVLYVFIKTKMQTRIDTLYVQLDRIGKKLN